MNIDGLIVGCAGVGLIAFVILHLGTYRCIRPGQVFPWLKLIFVISGIFSLVAFYFGMQSLAKSGLLISALNSVLVYGLTLTVFGFAAFHYILFIFGPHESSIRLRILREIDRCHPNPCTQDQLLKAYNANIILKRRLDRLLTDGNIVFDGQRYQLTLKPSFFMLVDRIAGGLSKIIEPTTSVQTPKSSNT